MGWLCTVRLDRSCLCVLSIALFNRREALGYHEGMLSAGHREQSIQVFSDLDSAISQIMDFTGSVFLKGSNFYNLVILLNLCVIVPDNKEILCLAI